MPSPTFDIQLLKVSLDVPLLKKVGELTNLVLVTSRIDARRAGKTFNTSEGKRFPEAELMKVKTNGVGLLPCYYVVCRPESEQQAVVLIQEALRKHLAPVLKYYTAVGEASERELVVKTSETYMKELMAG